MCIRDRKSGDKTKIVFGDLGGNERLVDLLTSDNKRSTAFNEGQNILTELQDLKTLIAKYTESGNVQGVGSLQSKGANMKKMFNEYLVGNKFGGTRGKQDSISVSYTH